MVELYLQNNNLTEITTDIGQLREVQIIDFSGNPIEKASRKLGGLIYLEKLKIDNFQEVKIPKTAADAIENNMMSNVN